MMPGAEDSKHIMEVYRLGIELIKAIQTVKGPLLLSIMKLITEMGSEKFYIPAILFIFYWIDEKRAFRLGVLVIVSAWINLFLKNVLKQPRPFNLEPSLGLIHESGYGVPSGHAQMSLCFWIPSAAWLAEKRTKRNAFFIWGAALLIILLISFSRLYLGVHFPTDILCGFILGGLTLALWFTLGSRLEKFFAAAGHRVQNICAAAAAFLMNGLYGGDRSLPGLFLGFCLGYALMKKRFPFSAAADINGKKPGPPAMVLRCLVGFAGIAIIMLPAGFFPITGTVNFIRFLLAGFWGSAGAPFMFRRLSLAHNAPAAGS